MLRKMLLGFMLGLWGVAAINTATAREEIEVGFPVAGTQLTFEKVSADKTEAIKWIAVDVTYYKNRPVHRLISNEGFEYYDAETKSWVATMLNGKMKEVSPHNGQLSSPLWVGKEWQNEHLYPRADGSQALQKKTWKVEARESVTVPAGSFDTFRIKSESKALSITLWYAPAINFYVKRVTEGMIHVEQQLVEYQAPPAR